jgi:acetyl esterase/lipase
MRRPNSKSFLYLFSALCTLGASAQEKHQVIPLWPNGVPGFENRRNEPEIARDYYVKNIHNPSITVYAPPVGKSNGTAVLICPGGGHRLLVITSEGAQPAKFLNDLGITAFVLKYRLAREENSPYQLEKASAEDAFRAMKLIRSRASQWKLDTNRIGVMGFSAGGEVVNMISYGEGKVGPLSNDAIDHGNAHPNFSIQVYPGPLAIPETIPPDAPPAFLVAASDDSCCATPVVTLLERYRKAKIPVEAHIFAQGDHAFNMGDRSNLRSIRAWSQRLSDWLYDNKWIPETKAR